MPSATHRSSASQHAVYDNIIRTLFFLILHIFLFLCISIVAHPCEQHLRGWLYNIIDCHTVVAGNTRLFQVRCVCFFFTAYVEGVRLTLLVMRIERYIEYGVHTLNERCSRQIE